MVSLSTAPIMKIMQGNPVSICQELVFILLVIHLPLFYKILMCQLATKHFESIF